MKLMISLYLDEVDTLDDVDIDDEKLRLSMSINESNS